jgi:hypothetical protein
MKKKLTLKDLRMARNEILKNVRKHCSELYPKNGKKEACRVAAAIAAAEIADVFKERFGIKI